MENSLEKVNINDTVQTIFDGVEALVNTKKVIGEPYVIGDTTIVPFVESNVGMAVGAFNKDQKAGGMSCKISPVACLVIQNGFTKLINIKDQDAITKALDMIPDLVDTVFKRPELSPEVKDTIKKLAKKK